MFCTNCGSQLPDGSKFCTNCGAQLVNGNNDEGHAKRININTGNVNVEDVKAATKDSVNSIIAVLKDPSQKVELTAGSRIATVVFEMLAHIVFFLLLGLMFKNIMKIAMSFSGSSYGSYLSDISFTPSILWSIIGGIVMVVVLLAFFMLTFCVEEKQFNMNHIDDAIVAAILPSAGLLLTGVGFCIHYYLGMLLGLLTVVAVIITAAQFMPTSNRYIVIAAVTIGYIIVIWIFYKLFSQNLLNLSMSYQGETVKVKDLVSNISSLF